MEILKKIRAFFHLQGRQVEMTLEAAEIRGNKVFLHPADDPEHTVCVKACAVDLYINPLAETPDEDVSMIDHKKRRTDRQDVPLTDGMKSKAQKGPSKAEPTEKSSQNTYEPVDVDYKQFMPKMRTVSMRLYQEEYEMLMENIQVNGYKKTEYLLACVAAAKKKSMQTEYQKYYTEHQQRRKEAREAAKARAEQYNLNP